MRDICAAGYRRSTNGIFMHTFSFRVPFECRRKEIERERWSIDIKSKIFWKLVFVAHDNDESLISSVAYVWYMYFVGPNDNTVYAV